MIDTLLKDMAFWSYGVNAAASLYGFFLFIYWWRKVGDASSVYKYFTVLMFAIFIVYGGNVHIRVLMAIDPQRALSFSHSIPWYARTWLEGLILTIIVFMMTRRLIYTLKRIARFEVEEKKDV